MPSLCADVAQLVEQRIRNAKVTSSIPVIGTTQYTKVGRKPQYMQGLRPFSRPE